LTYTCILGVAAVFAVFIVGHQAPLNLGYFQDSGAVELNLMNPSDDDYQDIDLIVSADFPNDVVAGVRQLTSAPNVTFPDTDPLVTVKAGQLALPMPDPSAPGGVRIYTNVLRVHCDKLTRFSGLKILINLESFDHRKPFPVNSVDRLHVSSRLRGKFREYGIDQDAALNKPNVSF
jgi:hypothetical protein